MYLAGLDIGTGGCKVSVYDHTGGLTETHYREYNSIHENGVHEIDGNEIYAAVAYVLEKIEHKPAALGVTSFGETFVLLDENDKVLCNSMLYTDTRGDNECKELDRELVKAVAFCVPQGMFSIPKLMWIKNNRPEMFSKVKRILLMQDFITYMLTGNACIDYSLASRTMGFDIKNKAWSGEIFHMAGIDTELMSTPVPCGTVAGVSNKHGLCDTKIVVGCHDQTAAAIGAGALEKGCAVDGSGSVECITPIIDELPKDSLACDSGVAYIPFVDNKYSACAFSFTGGTAIKWFRDNFAPDMSYRELDEKIGDEIGKMLVLPHFAGAATPYMDPFSSAVFHGVTLDCTKYDLYRAIMEGVVYEMKINLDELGKYVSLPNKLLATGGGSKSPVWLQMKADILDLPITVIDAPEVGALGTIMLCAVAVGAVQNLSNAGEIFVKKGKTYYPRKEKHEMYMKYYEKYKLIYGSSKDWRQKDE